MPFDQMVKGDSFFVPTLHPEELLYVIDTRAKTARVRIRAYKTTDDGVLGVRVWRTR